MKLLCRTLAGGHERTVGVKRLTLLPYRLDEILLIAYRLLSTDTHGVYILVLCAHRHMYNIQSINIVVSNVHVWCIWYGGHS